MLHFIICVLCTSAIVFFAYYWINIRWDYFKKRKIFHIRPTWKPKEWYRELFQVSAISHYENLYLRTEPHRYVGIYQNLFTPTLFLRDPDLIRTVLSKDFVNFSSRIKVSVSKRDSSAYFLTNMDGERWHRTRKDLSPVFTPNRLKFLLSLFEKPSLELLTKVGDNLKEPIDILTLSTRYQLHVTAYSLFSIDANVVHDEESLIYKMSRRLFSPLKSYILRALFSITPVALRPYIRHRVFNQESESYFRHLLEDVIRARQMALKDKRPDFVEHLLKLKQRMEDSKGQITDWTSESLLAQCLLFIIGGTFAPAALISWALHEIAGAPTIQTKLYEEVRSILEKSNGQITIENFQEMIYLNKVVLETLRKYPLASFILQRECVKTCRLSDTDVVVEKGMRIMMPIGGIHYDPKFYPKPDIFDPERFDEENKRNRHPFVFIPFGKGPRSCIGETFSIFCVKYAIVRIILNFEVKPAPNLNNEYPHRTFEEAMLNIDRMKIIFNQRKI